MILYKNVDICDLDSITQSGILSMDQCGNDNWGDGKRAKNATNVVYLFRPTGIQNSFPNYGVALLEVEVDAKKTGMDARDCNIGKYEEFVTEKVEPFQIKNIFIPAIFRSRVNVPLDILRKIRWCGFSAEEYDRYEDGKSYYKKLTPDRKRLFSKTAEIENSATFNFFRGEAPDRTMIDLYNIVYRIDEAYKFARLEDYDDICHELGFLPDIQFVEITNVGTITFTCGKPHEIRALYDAIIRCGYKPARSLIQRIRCL